MKNVRNKKENINSRIAEIHSIGKLSVTAWSYTDPNLAKSLSKVLSYIQSILL